MRGRRAQSAEVKALKGNPGKRRLALQNPKKFAGKSKPIAIGIPDWLTDERERQIFVDVIKDYSQQRIARQTDLYAYGRYAVWMSRWLQCKEWLNGKVTWVKSKSKWGEMVRRHPAAKDLFDIEDKLQKLEDRLALNPAARQSIFNRIAAVPPTVLDDDETSRKAEVAHQDDDPPAHQQTAAEQSPLGYLQNRRLN